ncbi:hypothetical protein [Pedobacter nyackensis]|uniref:hypothetical protein n=1 Tax=Pedobacter nyackensis TaxID=475255 RepID=UPI00292D10D3|nr:hypothetical protein [Pedobacter nyackensis]
MTSSKSLARYGLLILFIVIAAISCKKDGAQLARISEELRGKWNVQSNKMIYYDESGQKEYEEILERPGDATEVDFTIGPKANILSKSDQSISTTYKLTQEKKSVYIELHEAEIFDAKKWEISDVSAGKLTWTANFPNVKYEDKETGEIVEAYNAELILDLIKQ